VLLRWEHRVWQRRQLYRAALVRALQRLCNSHSCSRNSICNHRSGFRQA
jgi:hypothetical protein